MKKAENYLRLRMGIVLILFGGWQILTGHSMGYIPFLGGIISILLDVMDVLRKQKK